LFSGHIESVEEPAAEESAPGAATLGERVRRLEEWVQRLQAEIDALKTGAKSPRAPATGD
jgi:hypothetical protein